MRKKLLLLALGVVAFCSTIFSQAYDVPVDPNSILTVGTVITVTELGAGTQYLYQVVTAPAVNSGFLGVLANAVMGAFNIFNIRGTLIAGGPTGSFGNEDGQFALQAVPFDFGISAVLGAGAIAAVKVGRRRKKQEATA